MTEDEELQNEYQHIKSDIKKVIIFNLLIVLILVGLFIANKKMGIVSNLTRFF